MWHSPQINKSPYFIQYMLYSEISKSVNCSDTKVKMTQEHNDLSVVCVLILSHMMHSSLWIYCRLCKLQEG